MGERKGLKKKVRFLYLVDYISINILLKQNKTKNKWRPALKIPWADKTSLVLYIKKHTP